MNEECNEKLIEACLAGNDEAWRQFIKMYGGLIHGIVNKFFYREPEFVEDMTQNIYLELLTHLGRLKIRTLNGYISTMTYCRCIDEVRRRKRAPYMNSLDEKREDGSTKYEPEAANLSPENDMHEKDLLMYLREAVMGMRKRCRYFLMLKFKDELTIAQIAEYSNESESYVTNWLYRCLKKLKEKMLKIYGPLEGNW